MAVYLWLDLLFQFRGSKIPELSAGMQGILITTNDKEKMCVSEAYNLLNEVSLSSVSIACIIWCTCERMCPLGILF